MMMSSVISSTLLPEIIVAYFAFNWAMVVFASPISLLPNGGSLNFGSSKSFMHDVAVKSISAIIDRYFIAFIFFISFLF